MQQEFSEVKAVGMQNAKYKKPILNTQVKAKVKVENSERKSIY